MTERKGPVTRLETIAALAYLRRTPHATVRDVRDALHLDGDASGESRARHILDRLVADGAATKTKTIVRRHLGGETHAMRVWTYSKKEKSE